MDNYLSAFDEVLQERCNNILKSTKRPKFKISRVPEELRLVHVHVDIEYQQYIIRDEFEWNLSDQHISPLEYCQKLVERIGFGNISDMHKQLIFQLMEYIEKHSFAVPEPQITYKKMLSEKKKQQRVRQQGLKSTRLSFQLNKRCPNCDHLNHQGGVHCKKCKLSFAVLESLSSEPITKACLLFYEIVSQKSAVDAKKLIKEDFCSLYTMKDKLLELQGDESVIEVAFAEFMKHKNNPDLLSIVGQLKNQKGGRVTRRQQSANKKEVQEEVEEQNESEDQSEQDNDEEEEQNEDEDEQQESEEQSEDEEDNEEKDDINDQKNKEKNKEKKEKQEESMIVEEESESQSISKNEKVVKKSSKQKEKAQPRIRTRRVVQEEISIQRRSVRKRK